MPFAVFKNEGKLEDLVARLFSPDRKPSKTMAKQATAALLRANPQLENLGQLPAGSLITIPDSAPPVVPSEAVRGPAPALAVAAAQAQQLVELLASQLAAIDVRARDATKSLTELAKVKDIQRGVADIPSLIEALPPVVKPSKTIVKDLEKGLKARDEAVSNLLGHVASLAGIKAVETK